MQAAGGLVDVLEIVNIRDAVTCDIRAACLGLERVIPGDMQVRVRIVDILVLASGIMCAGGQVVIQSGDIQNVHGTVVIHISLVVLEIGIFGIALIAADSTLLVGLFEMIETAFLLHNGGKAVGRLVHDVVVIGGAELPVIVSIRLPCRTGGMGVCGSIIVAGTGNGHKLILAERYHVSGYIAVSLACTPIALQHPRTGGGSLDENCRVLPAISFVLIAKNQEVAGHSFFQ